MLIGIVKNVQNEQTEQKLRFLRSELFLHHLAYEDIMKTITSKDNPAVKRVKKLYKKSFRDECGVFLAEGERLVFDAVKSGAQIETLFVTGKFSDVNISADNVYTVDEKIIAGISDTASPQGILAVVKRQEYSSSDISEPCVICDRVSDPGNLGTIIRTADAAGFGSVELLPGCVDAFSPKVVRASMGSVFHIPVIECEFSEIMGMSLLCADLENSDYIYDYDFRKPFGVVIGNEANGVSDSVMSACDARIKIPMPGKSESLNAAVSFGVIAFEALRQRLRG